MRLLSGSSGTDAGWITANTGFSSISFPLAASACNFICEYTCDAMFTSFCNLVPSDMAAFSISPRLWS